MKLITKINDKISIWGDESQYIVRFLKGKGKNKKGETIDRYESWYLGTLDQAFQEIFECLNRKNLLKGREKSLEEVKNIILDTRAEILEIIKPFLEPE